MTIIVFAGPSLPAACRPAGPFEWHPPATAGDLLALADDRPERVCLIDGLFDSCAAPWHKELLVLMANGTMVFGASSMGALRAAELHMFGMVGVGHIFEAYRDGRLDGDDEVALIHATEPLDWAPLTVPMIEMRATLAAACRAGLLSIDAARRIRTRVRDIFFGERDWPLMRRVCVDEGLAGEPVFHRLEALHVPLKRRDALACLAVAEAWDGPPPRVAPPPNTCFLRKLGEDVRARAAHAG